MRTIDLDLLRQVTTERIHHEGLKGDEGML